MKRQTARLGTIILVLLTLIGGVAHAQRPARVRLGLPVESLDGLALFVAQNRGFFTEQGIEAEITILRGGTGVIQTLVSGDIDIGMVGPVEVSLLRDKGVDVRLAMTTIDVPPFSLVVSREASITSVAGLRGRSIGVTSPGSLTYGLARYFVLKAGLQPDKDVTLLSLGGGPEMVGAFKAKKADALMLFEPFAQVLLAEGGATVLVDVPKELKGFPVFCVTVKKSLIDTNPELVRKTSAALVRALRFMKSDEAGTRAIAQKKFPGIKPEVLNPALDRYLPHFSKDGVLTAETIQSAQEVLKAAGLIQTILPYQEIVVQLR